MLAVTCLALAIYYEARDQPIDGQTEVGMVVMNRVADDKFPNDVCSVVYDPNQFSFTNDGKPEKPKHHSWKAIKVLAKDILNHPNKYDDGNNVLYYHATYVEPSWVGGYQLVGKIEDHIFYTRKEGSNDR